MHNIYIFYGNFAKPMFVKNVYIFLELSSPRACCIVDGFPRICRELLNLWYSRLDIVFYVFDSQLFVTEFYIIFHYKS